MTVGFCASDSAVAAQMLLQLQERDSAYLFLSYDTVEELEEAVRAGSLECGFWAEADFDDCVAQGDLRECVHYICTPMTTKGEVAKETVYAAFFELYSDEILITNEELFFGNKSLEREADWIQRNHERSQSSGLFCVEYLEVESAVSTQEAGTVYPVQGTVGLMLLFILFLSHGRRFEPGGLAVEKALMAGERFWYSCTGMLASGTIPALTGLVLVAGSRGSRGVWQEIAAMLLFLLEAVIWIWLIGKLQHSMEGQIAFILCILVLNILICPIFFDLSDYVPAIQYIRYISPLGLYLANIW